ncbi:MAG TPA: methyltransferase domain-containing protein [Bacteroidales bacterium]
MTKFSFKRNFFSYHKVQLGISFIIRNSTLLQNINKLEQKKYLDIGCGTRMHDKFINLDYKWVPGLDICWDITKGSLPFPNNRFEGIFSEHCLEHIKLEETKQLCKDILRILKPNGIFRIIVPDGELYFDLYQKIKKNKSIKMPYYDGYTPISRINDIFRHFGHLFIYDFDTIQKLLSESGFKNIEKKKYLESLNTDLLLDSEERVIESLYVEAQK